VNLVEGENTVSRLQKRNQSLSEFKRKLNLESKLVKQVPGNHRAYIDLFFNTGCLYFEKEPSVIEIVNDVDGNLIELYEMVQVHTHEKEHLKQYLTSYQGQSMKDESEDSDEIQRVLQYFLLLSHCTNEKKNNLNASSLSSCILNTDYMHNLLKRMGNTCKENRDFEQIVKDYDSPYSFFFCDPPDLHIDDLQRLKTVLCNIKGNFLLTTTMHPEMVKLFQGFYIQRIPAGLMQENQVLYEEVIITNYPLEFQESIA